MSATAFQRMRREQEEKEREKKKEENSNPLEDLTVKELKEKCEELGLEGYKSLNKAELIKLLEDK